MDKQPSVCSKCSVGCNVTLWQRRGQLVRVTSRENDAIDDGWICDRGRFDYTYVNQEDRIRSPKVDGQPASWDQALSTVALGLSQVPAAKLGIHLPADITNEEVFLLSQLLAGPWRGAKVSMAGRTRLPLASVPTMKISDLDKAKTIVVIASDTRVEVPVLNLRIKKAVKKLGANLIVVHPATLDLVERWQSTIHIQPGKEGTIAAINQLKLHPTLKEGPVAILYGDMAGNEDGEAISTAVAELATAVGASVLPLYRGANERGALEAGILNANGDFKGVEALLTWGSTPKNLPKTVKFLTIWESNSRSGQEAAAVVLPAATFAETQGTYMNLDGTIQPLGPVLTVESPLRESWEVLLELSQLLGLQTSYLGPAEIQKAAAEAIPAFATLAANPEPSATPVRVMMGPARP
jgi:NADH-quinone oxidoreductase subunit G